MFFSTFLLNNVISSVDKTIEERIWSLKILRGVNSTNLLISGKISPKF
jgi:hypothetical protein